MKFSEFETLVHTYGADVARWPDAKKADMLRVINTHPQQADVVLEAARTLDNALDTVPAPPASDLLRSRIRKAALASQPTPAVSRQPFRKPSQTWYRTAAMIAVSFGAGFTGAQFLEHPQSSTPAETFIAETSEIEWELAAMELGLTDIYEWTSGEDITAPITDL